MPSSLKPQASSPRERPSGRRPLTVLQIIPALETGGAERTAIDIAATLAARGDRALVASVGGRMEAELAAAGGELIRLPTDTKNPVRLALLALKLMRIVRAETVDIVHARSRAPAWAARLAARRTDTPFVTTYHGIYGERNAMKRRYNAIMAAGDTVIANSHYTADLIGRRYGTPAQRIAIIPRGTDPARFSRDAVSEARRDALRQAWSLPPDARVVLNLARLTGWKGQSVLVEAAAAMPSAERQGLAIVLAGDAQGRTQHRRALENSIARHDLTGCVRIVGHCEDVPAALALADLAVVASTEPEAFGRTAIEAASMGVPVVATALGATAETVLAPPLYPEAERTGWLVPPGDASALAGAMAEALALSPAERQALAGRARAHAQGFSTAAMQAATLAVYDSLRARRIG